MLTISSPDIGNIAMSLYDIMYVHVLCVMWASSSASEREGHSPKSPTQYKPTPTVHHTAHMNTDAGVQYSAIENLMTILFAVSLLLEIHLIYVLNKIYHYPLMVKQKAVTYDLSSGKWCTPTMAGHHSLCNLMNTFSTDTRRAA